MKDGAAFPVSINYSPRTVTLLEHRRWGLALKITENHCGALARSPSLGCCFSLQVPILGFFIDHSGLLSVAMVLSFHFVCREGHPSPCV